MEENNATITPLPLEVDDKTNHPLDDTKVRSSRGDVPNKPITGPQGMDSPTHAMNTVTYGGEAGYSPQGYTFDSNPHANAQGDNDHAKPSDKSGGGGWLGKVGNMIDGGPTCKKFSQKHFRYCKWLSEAKDFEDWVSSLYSIWQQNFYEEEDALMSMRMTIKIKESYRDKQVMAAVALLKRFDGSVEEAIQQLRTLFTPQNAESLLEEWANLKQGTDRIAAWHSRVLSLSRELNHVREPVEPARVKSAFIRNLNRLYKSQLEILFPNATFKNAELYVIVRAFSGWEQRNAEVVEEFLNKPQKNSMHYRTPSPSKEHDIRNLQQSVNDIRETVLHLTSLVQETRVGEGKEAQPDVNHMGELEVVFMIQRQFPQNCWRCWAEGHRALQCPTKVQPQKVWDKQRRRPVCPICRKQECRRDLCPQRVVLGKDGIPQTEWNSKLKRQTCYRCRQANCNGDPCRNGPKLDENLQRWGNLSLDRINEKKEL